MSHFDPGWAFFGILLQDPLKTDFGPTWGPSWAPLGPILGPFGLMLSPLWLSWGCLGAGLGASGPHLGPLWLSGGRLKGYLVASAGACRRYLAQACVDSGSAATYYHEIAHHCQSNSDVQTYAVNSNSDVRLYGACGAFRKTSCSTIIINCVVIC